MAAFGVVVVGVASYSAYRSFRETSDAKQAGREEGQRLLRELAASAPTENDPTERVSPSRTRAAAAWNAFDRLRDDQGRSLPMLQAHLLQANQGLDFLPPDEAKRVRDSNEVEFRRRVPGVLIPGERGIARGADAGVIVPSNDAARCVQLANAWLAGAQRDMLRAYGFKTIECQSQDCISESKP